jgi:predicted DNA-binding protein
MKRVPFNANEKDESRLEDLTKKLGITVTAVIREAIRDMHKKEIGK